MSRLNLEWLLSLSVLWGVENSVNRRHRPLRNCRCCFCFLTAHTATNGWQILNSKKSPSRQAGYGRLPYSCSPRQSTSIRTQTFCLSLLLKGYPIYVFRIIFHRHLDKPLPKFLIIKILPEVLLLLATLILINSEPTSLLAKSCLSGKYWSSGLGAWLRLHEGVEWGAVPSDSMPVRCDPGRGLSLSGWLRKPEVFRGFLRGWPGAMVKVEDFISRERIDESLIYWRVEQD